MKLGTIDDGSRDGSLVVVDAVGGRAVCVSDLVPTMQRAIDDWERVRPMLQSVADALHRGAVKDTLRFEDVRWRAPLPRAYQLLDAAGYRPHLEINFQRRGLALPQDVTQTPVLVQSVSDANLGPSDPIALPDRDLGIDFEAELVIVTDDVPQGASSDDCAQRVLLIGLMNDISLRGEQQAEFARGAGLFRSKPKKAFAPFFVTPDELGASWADGRAHVEVRVDLNGLQFARVHAGEDCLFGFDALVARAAELRELRAGTIIGSGTVSNQDRSRGQCCIQERRAVDELAGKRLTPFLVPGDRVRIAAHLPDGSNVFGTIDQRLTVLR